MTDPSTVTAFLHACIDDDETVATGELGSYWPPGLPHRNCWTPARVLAELVVKRELLAEVEIELTRTVQPQLPYHARLLVHPYRDRPGFREEWALPPDVA
jgi:hypothetical protein